MSRKVAVFNKWKHKGKFIIYIFSKSVLFNMANRCGQIFIRNVLFFSLFCHSFSSIYGLELASSNGYVRREHSLSKPFQGAAF